MKQDQSDSFDDMRRLSPFWRRSSLKSRTKAKRWTAYLTLQNIVLVLGGLTFFIFLQGVTSSRVMWVVFALGAITVLIFFEMVTRRKWEKDLLSELARMREDYDRIVRETARHRNEVMTLKRSLAEAGASARREAAQIGAEQRMITALAEHLLKIGIGDVSQAAQDVHVSVPSDIQTEGRNADEVIRALTDGQVLEWVRNAVRHDCIDVFAQPVVTLPQRKCRFYEMFSRIRVGPHVYLTAERYISLAMRYELLPLIDNLLLLRTLQILRNAKEESLMHSFFCNITSLTLNDPKFMGDLVEFLAVHRNLAPRLIFELAQSDLATMNLESVPILDGLAQLGCRFSMGIVRTLNIDLSFLEARHIRFVKIESSIINKILKEAEGFVRLKRLKLDLDAIGIDLIVEKIENERHVMDLLDLEIDYGQGFLFGKPEVWASLEEA